MSEGGARGSVCDRGESADEHVVHTVPIQQADEGFGVERRGIRITHGATLRRIS